jgi:hypothetical protein
MAEIMESKLKIESWDEKPYLELPDGQKLARASVVLSDGGSGLTGGSFEALLHYLPDGTSTYVSLMRVTGTVGGREGGFTLTGRGSYDGTSARGESVVVAGSGTGELAGITGTAESVSTHADYPYMPLTIRYDLG